MAKTRDEVVLCSDNEFDFESLTANGTWIYGLCLILNANPVLLLRMQITVEPSPPERGEQKAHTETHFLFVKANTVGTCSMWQVLYTLSNNTFVFLCACHRKKFKKWALLVFKNVIGVETQSRDLPVCKTKEWQSKQRDWLCYSLLYYRMYSLEVLKVKVLLCSYCGFRPDWKLY